MSRKASKIWTPANVVTLVRICLVPVFVVVLLSPWPTWFSLENLISAQVKSFIATAVFIGISCTDWLDGYLARSRGEVTDFGKFIDPLADKILVLAALLALVELQVLPSWPVLIILAREFIVSGIRMIAAARGVVIAASWYGKAKTVFQIIAIVLFLLKDSLYLPDIASVSANPIYIIAWIVMVIALGLTIISMLDYISKASSMLGFDKKGEAKKGEVKNSDRCVYKNEDEISSLAAKLVEIATDKNITIATAESLTGGKIAATITSVSGSSAVFKGSIVSYVNSVKDELLGVDGARLRSEGAVDANIAKQMAKGALDALKTDIAISVTGIAGPTGAEPGKPVGTVFVGWATKKACDSNRYQFEGDREQVRNSTTFQALITLLDLVSSN